MDATVANDRKRVLLPFGALGALATTPEASSSDSDDPCADDASDPSGRPEVRYDKIIEGSTCIFSRDEFLDFYGDVEGATRWERARVCDSDDSSSDSSGCPETELRHDEAIPGPGCFPRDAFLDFYSDV